MRSLYTPLAAAAEAGSDTSAVCYAVPPPPLRWTYFPVSRILDRYSQLFPRIMKDTKEKLDGGVTPTMAGLFPRLAT